jgi:hypothetical protein
MNAFSKLIAGAAMIAAAVPATARAPGGEAELGRLLAGRIAGAPVSCVPLYNLGSAQIVDGVGIVYRVGSKLYVNRPRTDARWLDDDDILVVRSFGSQLCNADRVDLIDRNSRMWSGFVSLGDFVPYTRPKAK